MNGWEQFKLALIIFQASQQQRQCSTILCLSRRVSGVEDVFVLRVERRGFPYGGDGVDFIKLADVPKQRGGVQLKVVVFLLVLINEPDFFLQSGDSPFTRSLD